MKTELQIVTPAICRDWLKFNTDNRPLRPGIVDGLRIAWDRGEWKTTHQGIAFSKSKRLLDGQHRLTFISQLPEGTRVAINVSSDCDDDLFDAIDQGARRTPSDVLGVSTDLSALGRLFARIANGNQSSGMSIQFVAPYVAWVTPEYEELITFAPAKREIWSSAPVRAAAVFQMKRGSDPDYVKIAYHSLITSDIDSMPYAARALMQQRMSGKIVSARTLDLFCRSLRAFDSTRQGKIKTILVTDQAGTIEDVRKFVANAMKKGPAKAGPMVAKPVVEFKAKRQA